MKIKKYFSFGQAHIHKYDKVILDKDCLLCIEAENPRAEMFRIFGSKWSMEYDSLDKLNIAFFPRGVVLTITI